MSDARTPWGVPAPESGPAQASTRAVPVVSVLVVSAVRLYRDGINRILEHRPGIRVIGATATYQAAAPILRDIDPDVVLLDAPISEATVALQALGGPVQKVVVLGIVESEPDVIAWAEAGAAGYVSREASSEELAATIEAVARGETLCSPRIVAALLRRVAALAQSPAHPGTRRDDCLTPREREVAGLIGDGLSNKEIARHLCIEVPTVKNHVHNVLKKLEVARRGQAAAHLRTDDGSERRR